MSRAQDWLVPRRTVFGAALLALLYLLSYQSDPALPGNDPAYPAGWWGWFDQGNYIKSTRSLTIGAMDQDRHWYPLGYALLGAPFAGRSPGHAYLLPDLLCLLAAYRGFLALAATLAIGRTVAILAFLLGTMGSASLRRAWSVPWNTTLSAALIWWMLALTAVLLVRRPRGVGRAMLLLVLGALACAVPAVRPTDAILLIVLSAVSIPLLAQRREVALRDAVPLAAGALLVAVPYARLYLRIYGWHETPYMLLSGRIGFSLHALWWRSYLLLVSPRPWFPQGAGLLERLPWIAPGLAFLVALPALRPGPALPTRAPALLLAATIAATWILFFAYNDLIPSGLWMFQNIHYFKWTMPGLLLLGILWWRHLRIASMRERSVVLATSAAFLLLGAIHLVPRRAGRADPVWMLQVGLPSSAPLLPTYFGSAIVAERRGTAVNTVDFRAVPDRQGERLIALQRPFAGILSVRLPSGETVPAGSRLTLWTIAPRLGWPCWFPRTRCDRIPPGA